MADCGLCDGCGGLTVRGTCRSCRRREAAERIARETTIRPEAVALLASERLLRGDALDFALCRVAAGRALIVRTLATLGVTLDRKTVAHALAELVDLGVLDRVGQLDGWMDMQPKGGPLAKRGAYVYALRVFCRKLGDWYQDAVQRARDRLVGGVPPLHAAVRGMGLGRRTDGCLSTAIRHAQVGQRNALGQLARLPKYRRRAERRRDEEGAQGLSGHVPQNPPHTLREAEATVRSRYRRALRASRR